jgi:glycosyltransferase involved in cell wall biosynthesis
VQVCFVSTIGYPTRTKLGGVPICTRNMAHALANLGTEVRVITKRLGDGPVEENDGPITIHGLPLGNVHYYFHRIAPIGIWPRVVKAFEWGRDISRFVGQLHQQDRVDLVVYSNVWIEASRHPKNVPFAVRMDTPLFVARPVPGCGDKTGWDTYERLEQRVVRRADAVICLTDSAARQIQIEYRLPADKIVVIPNPVDIDCFRPRRLATSAGHRIFHPGPRLDDWQKGTHILLDAMEDVIAAFPDTQLFLAGRGKPDLSKLSPSVVASIIPLGWLDSEELAKQYALADLTVVPSLNYDSFPTVCLESLAAGTPVIGSSVGGIPEVVRHMDTGLIVPPGDATALGKAIVRILSDAPLLKLMQQRARQTAEREYSLKSVGEKMSALCDRLVREHARPA